MENYTIIKFTNEPRFVDIFIFLPYSIYEHDNNWIPPLEEDVALFLNHKHPYRSFLKQKNFLLLNGNSDPIARAIAFVNNEYTIDNKPLGSIGFFESKNHPAGAKYLLEHACSWLKEQGVCKIWAPMNGTIWAKYRLLSKSFSRPPFLDEPYNPPYYPALLEAASFTVLKKWYTGTLTQKGVKILLRECRTSYHKSLKAGYSYRNFRLGNFDQDMTILYELVSESFSEFLGFHALSLTEFLDIYKGLEQVLVHRLSNFVFDPQSEPVGFLLTFQNNHRAFRALKGKKGILSKLKYVLHERRINGYSLLYLGLKKKERKIRKYHLGMALIYQTLERIHEKNIPIHLSLVAENTPFIRLFEHCKKEIEEYSLYSKNFT